MSYGRDNRGSAEEFIRIQNHFGGTAATEISGLNIPRLLCELLLKNARIRQAKKNATKNATGDVIVTSVSSFSGKRKRGLASAARTTVET